MATTAESSVQLAVVFSTGLMISVGHCVGMCGPIAAAFSAAQGPAGHRFRIGSALLTYQAGRLTTYGLLGALAGWFGASAAWGAAGRTTQGGVSLGVGLLMALLAFGLLGWLPTQRWVEENGLGGHVVCGARKLLRARSPGRRFGLGLLNGLLPCGPVYAMALAAAGTGRPLHGTLVMLLFGLGTVPAVTAVGAGTSWLAPRLRQRFYRMGSALVLLLALQLALRGLAALEVIGHLRFGELVVF